MDQRERYAGQKTTVMYGILKGMLDKKILSVKWFINTYLDLKFYDKYIRQLNGWSKISEELDDAYWAFVQECKNESS